MRAAQNQEDTLRKPQWCPLIKNPVEEELYLQKGNELPSQNPSHRGSGIEKI